MTKTEAIEYGLRWKNAICDRGDTENSEAVQFLNMAIKALEQEPSCRNTRQVDLISRQDAIAALDDIRYTDRQDWWAVLSTVENLPSVQPNPFCALADRECPFQGKEFAWCLTCPHISEEDRALVKKFASEPKRGRWVADRKNRGGFTPGGNSVKLCSLCGWIYGAHRIVPEYNYCPNCGADMRGDEE